MHGLSWCDILYLYNLYNIMYTVMIPETYAIRTLDSLA